MLVVNETELTILASSFSPDGGKAIIDPETGAPDQDRLVELCTQFLDKGVKHIIVTLGANGSFYLSRHQKNLPPNGRLFQATPVPKEKIVDTTCAGDTFLGALVATMAGAYGMWKGVFDDDADISSQPEAIVASIPAAIEMGHLASALAIQRRGAMASIPSAQELTDAYSIENSPF